jgi:hypothetical protein
VRNTGDSPPDRTADADGSEYWVSFEELAKARGVTKPSAIKLVRRHGWRRQRDNQGHVRALVPTAWLTPEETGEPDSTGESPADRTADISRTINVLQAAVASLTERAQVAERRADQAGARADRAEQGRTRAEERADRAEEELAGAQEALAGAETRLREAEAARAEFWSRSRWQRVRAVLRGRGG